MNIDRALTIVDVILLILIWIDGRMMCRSQIRIEHMYAKWFDERRAERVARQEAAKKARETKAAKAEQKEQPHG